MKFRQFCALLPVLLIAAGCAAVSEDECRSQNWVQIGYDAGVVGKTADFVDNVQRQCASYGIDANMAELRGGYRNGLRYYCANLDAYELGVSGGYYYGVCSSPRIARDWERGREVYRERLARESRQRRIRDLNEEIEDLETVLIDPNSSQAQREHARSRLVKLRRERDDLYYQDRW